MAVSANQIVKRRGRDGKIGHAGVAANKVIYEGTLCFADAGGDATDVKVDASTVFLGVARKMADNTGGADGDIQVEFWRDGEFYFPSSSLVAADLGAALHASDNYTTTKTATANPQIGTITEVVSATEALIAISGIGES